ncbi:MAG TPA: ribonuclease III [Methanocorpusculum sp.]|nr:ribonuclease III [Methanocorpusculum sp.]HJJ40475.1 ribonuclease III [Methanocorpusculum sp.]HJJ49810.1 ribonuclease III [Methanocorpusculum sp.]HJJ57353.1 ribonuclease III [Methanocorpusculum sp.]
MLPVTISSLYQKIGYVFTNTSYLQHALTRTAYAREHGLPIAKAMDYLAVLGDSVLDTVVIKDIIDAGVADKGEITRQKTNLVNMTVFRRLAESIDLASYVSWGKGEKEMRIWESGRVSAECFEALAGAVYLDGGIEAVETMFETVGGFPQRNCIETTRK